MRTKYIAAAALALLPTIASASETVTYSYDAKGRLTQVARSGGPNDGAVVAYQFDAADNRTAVSTTGAWLDDQGQPVAAVPLMGITIIGAPTS